MYTTPRPKLPAPVGHAGAPNIPGLGVPSKHPTQSAASPFNTGCINRRQFSFSAIAPFADIILTDVHLQGYLDSDAETQFRNILIIAGNSNEAVQEKWEAVLRSCEKPSGKKWVLDLYDSMIPVDTDIGPRHMVYPYKDPRVNLVLRKSAWICAGGCEAQNN
jgi:hypothetical protein